MAKKCPLLHHHPLLFIGFPLGLTILPIVTQKHGLPPETRAATCPQRAAYVREVPSEQLAFLWESSWSC